MDLDDRQRKLLFAAVAVALVALGMWLVWPRPDTTPRPTAPQPQFTAAAPSPANPIPGITASVSPDSFDIYRLLPFGKTDFANAATTAQKFIALVDTYRYDEPAQTYLDRLTPVTTPELLKEIKAGNFKPGLVAERTEQKATATGSASLGRIREIGDTSITFEISGIKEFDEGGQAGTEKTVWAVTVQYNGGSWRVYSYSPADIGQDGADTQ
ncbi:hypothetical protein GCM10027589_36100 [Actinocorallia lasiicapitis]